MPHYISDSVANHLYDRIGSILPSLSPFPNRSQSLTASSITQTIRPPSSLSNFAPASTMALTSAAQNRRQSWKDIIGIVEDLNCLSLESTATHLKIDSQIYPRFPPLDSSVRRLHEETGHHLSPAVLSFFRSKCAVLQEHTLLGYKNTVANMPSVSARTGIDDKDQQTGLSAGLEKWYEQAEAELISAIRASLTAKVSHPDSRESATST
jgi:hypothetical protein